MAYTFLGRCKGTTKAGTQCGHKSVFANGYCRQHGGDSSKFERERFERIKQKALWGFKKWKRKRQAVAK
jgi:hypothetical protein